jgi:RNA polymerase sigma factor (sigma-70 family)
VADPSTSELVRSAAAGDQAAWDQLVDRYSRLVWSIARSHRLGHADAADVYQTTWLRLVEHLTRLRDPEQLPSWLATTARNECRTMLRRSGRERPDESIADQIGLLPDMSAGPESAMLANEERAQVAQAFARLPDRCQQLLRLLLAEPGPTYADVADTMGIAVGGIGPTRRRCLEHLRTFLDDVPPREKKAW